MKKHTVLVLNSKNMAIFRPLSGRILAGFILTAVIGLFPLHGLSDNECGPAQPGDTVTCTGDQADTIVYRDPVNINLVGTTIKPLKLVRVHVLPSTASNVDSSIRTRGPVTLTQNNGNASMLYMANTVPTGNRLIHIGKDTKILREYNGNLSSKHPVLIEHSGNFAVKDDTIINDGIVTTTINDGKTGGSVSLAIKAKGTITTPSAGRATIINTGTVISKTTKNNGPAGIYIESDLHDLIDINNSGKVEVEADTGAVLAGIAAGTGRDGHGDIKIVNSGEITLLGSSLRAGILVIHNKHKSRASSTNIINSGKISSPHSTITKEIYGIYMSGRFLKKALNDKTTITQENGGDINLAGDGTIIGVHIHEISNSPFKIDIKGGRIHVEGKDAIGISTISNEGTIAVSGNAVIDASKGKMAIVDEKSNVTVTLGRNVSIKGGIILGDGSDTLTVDGTNLANVPLLDGGDDTGLSDKFIDVLTFKNVPIKMAGGKIKNWEQVVVDRGAALTLTDHQLTAGDGSAGTGLFNRGTLSLQNNTAGETLKLTGNYIGDGGALAVDVDFAKLTSDSLKVSGLVKGKSMIKVNSITSGKPLSRGEMVVVKAPNDSDKTDEDLSIVPDQRYNNDPHKGRFKESIYAWKLETKDTNWILASGDVSAKPKQFPAILAEIPAYTTLSTIGREITFNELDVLHTRIGELRKHTSDRATTGAVSPDQRSWSAWTKGTINQFELGLGSSFDADGTYGGVAIGFDKRFTLANNWHLFGGIFAGRNSGDFNTSGKGNRYTSHESADLDVVTRSVGVYGSFLNGNGTYVDTVAQYFVLDADINAAGLKSLVEGNAVAASIEAGHGFDLADGWILEPQAQLKLSRVTWDNFNDGTNDVSFDDHTYVTGGIGARFAKSFAVGVGEVKPWLYAGINHEFTDAPSITYAKHSFDAHGYATTIATRLGVTADLTRSIQLYGDVGYSADLDDYNAVRGDLGLRFTW